MKIRKCPVSGIRKIALVTFIKLSLSNTGLRGLPQKTKIF